MMRMLRGEHVLPIVHLEKRPMKTRVRDEDAPASAGHRLAYARWWWSQAGTAIADSAAHWTGCGSDSNRSDFNGSASGSGSSISGTSSDSDASDSVGVDGPRQHEAGQAGHGRGTRRRRNPVEVSTLLNSNSNDNTGGK